MTGRGQVLAAWAALAVASLAFAAPRVERPGLYYDEAFLAQQARGFVEPERAGLHPPSVRSTWIAGRPFPLKNAAYLGSLKSQLLIPPLALFGARVELVRLATLATGLLGLLFAMLWARQLFSTPVAIATGVLVAMDPAFVFLARYEWGPFTTGLLCRTLGSTALVAGWRDGKTWLLSLGGLVLGLGVYSRVDFALVLAASGAALLASAPAVVGLALRERRGAALALVLALVAGAAPMLVALPGIMEASGGVAGRGDLFYKLALLWSVLDGSHFARLIETGGRFDRIFEVEAQGALFGYAVALSAATLVFDLLRRSAPQRSSRQQKATVFVLTASALTALATLATPGAVRAHHTLNLLPFLHILVAAAAVRAFEQPRARIVAALCVAALLASQVVAIARTEELLDSTGGRGRWSDAIFALADELDATPGAVAVSLDWGFHEPLLFLTDSAELVEPIWWIPGRLGSGRPWLHQGDARHVYLVHGARYDLFGYGPDFLATARALGPERVEIRSHRDREGELAFESVRFLEPHVVVYTGSFEVRFSERAP